jgi:hypothetical protein
MRRRGAAGFDGRAQEVGELAVRELRTFMIDPHP